MMWALEELPPGQWTEKNLLTNLVFLFNKLNRHIECKYLPHYFIPDLNVMRATPESMFAIIREIIDTDKLLTSPNLVCPDLSGSEVYELLTSIKELANVMNKLKTICDRTMDTMGWKPSNNHDNQEIIVIDPDECIRIRIFRRAIIRMCDISQSSIDLRENIPPRFTSEKEYIKHLIEGSCHDELTYLETTLHDVECMLQANKHTP